MDQRTHLCLQIWKMNLEHTKESLAQNQNEMRLKSSFHWHSFSAYPMENRSSKSSNQVILKLSISTPWDGDSEKGWKTVGPFVAHIFVHHRFIFEMKFVHFKPSPWKRVLCVEGKKIPSYLHFVHFHSRSSTRNDYYFHCRISNPALNEIISSCEKVIEIQTKQTVAGEDWRNLPNIFHSSWLNVVMKLIEIEEEDEGGENVNEWVNFFNSLKL